MPLFAVTHKEWLGQDAFVIGGGSSLRQFDFSWLVGKNTVGCNDAFRLGPEVVQILLFSDQGWWQNVKWELEQFPNKIVTTAPALFPIEAANLLKMPREKHGLENGGDKLAFNYSTGASAINLALLLGANRVFLLGFDMRLSERQQSHWHDGHRRKITSKSCFTRFSSGMVKLRSFLPTKFPGASVYNVTPNGFSELNVFPKIGFQEMKDLHECNQQNAEAVCSLVGT